MFKQDGITIGDVLKMECMENAQVLAGINGINNVVSRVNIMADKEILNWVTPGELLFLTTYSFDVDDIKWQTDFIAKCAEKNLSGIGIKMYPNMEKLNDEVIELADKLNVPIINIKHSLPYSEIMTSILKEIFNRQAALLERMENIHNRIMNLILKEASIDEMADVVNENINNPVLIKLEFPDKTIKNFGEMDVQLTEALFNNAEKSFTQNFYKHNYEKLHISREFINGKYIKRLSKPIVIKDNIYGYIFTWAVNQPFGEFDFSVIEASISAISMELLKKLSIREVERRYRQEFMDDLLSGDDRRRIKAAESAVFFNMSQHSFFQVIFVNITLIETSDFENTDILINQAVIRMVQLIEKKLDEYKINGLASGSGENIILVVASKDNPKGNSNVRELIDNLSKTVFPKYDYLNINLGVGRCYSGIDNANKSFIDARNAINTAAILNKNRINYFEELGIFKLLCQKCLQSELEMFYSSAIEELVEYDRKKSTEMVKTLEAYFECNGNLKKMAEILFTHYNTISYRMNRIEEIMGVSMDNADERLSIEVALKIKQYLKK